MIAFLTLCSFILDSWNESYPGNEIPPNVQGYTQVNQYKVLTIGNFYIFHVTFTTVNEAETDRGAILINTAVNLLVESSNFIHCHSKGQGGAIYFSNVNSKSFLKKVCSTNSYSSSNENHFCCISTKNIDQCTNCMEHTSVTNLYSTTNTNIYLLNSGVIILKHDNISKNICNSRSALWCFPSIRSSVSYTSFENQTTINAYGDAIIFDNNNNHDMNTCNVIGNTGRTIIFVLGSLKISNSCLIENQKPMFLFNSKSSSCKIINCTIDDTSKYDGDGKVTVVKNSNPIKSFINNLNNNDCFTMNDSDDKNAPKSKCICKTVNMKGNRCNKQRRRDNYLLLIF